MIQQDAFLDETVFLWFFPAGFADEKNWNNGIR